MRTCPSPGPGPYQNIALIRLSSVGDVIMALPALEGLRETYPRARLTWIVESRARNLLEDHPALDEIIEFPRDRWRSQWRRRFGLARSLPDIIQFYRGLKRYRFDLTIDFQGNLKSASCTLGARAPVRVGYAREECRESNHHFTNLHRTLGGQAVHRVDRDLLLVGLVGVPFGFRRPRLVFGPGDRQVGEHLIPRPGSGSAVVVLHPGTSGFMPHKRWPLSSYAQVGDHLARAVGARVMLSWGPGEEVLVEALAGLMEETAEILPATPTMKSLGHVLSRADLVIGGDTGPVHLASIQGVPTLSIMGPSDPRYYYPYGHPERVFYRRLPCSPCRHRSCSQLTCLADIAPGAVAAKALDLLKTRRNRAPASPPAG